MFPIFDLSSNLKLNSIRRTIQQLVFYWGAKKVVQFNANKRSENAVIMHRFDLEKALNNTAQVYGCLSNFCS